MQKILAFLGGVFLVLLVLAGAGAVYFWQARNNYEAESKQYADTAVPMIIEHWNVDVFYKFADHKALELNGITPSQVSALFNRFKGLGAFKQYDGSRGKAFISFVNFKESVAAQYVCEAEFQSMKVFILLVLSKDTGEWKILKFDVHKSLEAESGKK